ncbi:hypothetical protein [Amycolatopsis sp. NPDC004378]
MDSHSTGDFLPTTEEIEEMGRRVTGAVLGGGADRAAHYAEHGRWVYRPIDEASRWVGADYDHGNWTTGFWAGAMLHLAQLGCADDGLVERARTLAAKLDCRVDDHGTHDIGFIFWPSAALVARLFGDPAAASSALRAAEVLAERRVPGSGHLQAFGAVGEDRSRPTSTIDTMMNLPLLWWAHHHTGAPEWAEIARAHADRTARSLLRPDGSTYHLARIGDDGEAFWQGTFQGAADDSCWARGQAWGIAGYLTMACETGSAEYGRIAARLLGYYCGSHDIDALTPYDLVVDTGIQDSSAAAIVCYGLALTLRQDPDLARLVGAEERLTRILRALRRDALFQDEVGVLAHACYSAPHRLGMDGPLPYGDYYYLAALALVRGVADLVPERTITPG